MTKNGDIVWRDLTVPAAEPVRDFYGTVLGWTFSSHEMEGYVDYNVHSADGDIIAGICNARGPNAHVPAQWLLYVHVDDVGSACERAVAAGGRIVDGPRAMGARRFAVISDPAGAVMALIGR
jgi:uncharacterized protein